MSMRYKGGVISATPPTTSLSSAPGIWTLKQQLQGIAADNWPGRPIDYQFNYVTMLLPGNGTNGAQNNTFLDSSANNFSITRNGNTTQGTFAPYGANWSNYFDGTGDYLSAADDAAFQFGTSPFTIECWVYLTTSAPNYGFIVGQSWTSADTQWALHIQADKVVFCSWFAGTIYLVDSAALPLNSWNHIVVCRDASNNNALFVNGSRKAYTAATSYNWSSNSGAKIGGAGGIPSGNYITGYVSNVRIVKGTAVYAPTQTTLSVPTAPLTAITNTSLLTCQSNRFRDNSANNFTITRNGDVSVQVFSPFSPTASYAAGTNGGSGYFDGTGDYLESAYNAAFSLGTTFTIESWVYLTSQPSSLGGRIIGLGNGASGSTAFTAWSIIAFPASLRFYRYDGTTEFNYTSSTNLTLNAWNHVAVVRNSSDDFAIFLNGTRTYNATISQSFANVNTDSLFVGRTISGGGGGSDYYINGYVSNARVVKGTAVYDPTQTTLTVPTAPLTAITNTSLLLNYTNAGVIDNAMMNNLETVGNAQISTTQSKWGGSSIAFDGTGDQLSSPTSVNNSLGTGDFTVECWVYANSFSSQPCIVDARPTGTAVPWAFYINTIGQPYFYNGSVLTSTVAVSTTTWTHIAASRSSGTLRIFVNGTQGYSASVTTDLTAGGLQIGGAFSGSYLGGYIDDLRITKGFARYTANFTPPTHPFTGFAPIHPVGEQSYTTPGTYTFTVPAGVILISVVCIGGGGGYSGGSNSGGASSVGSFCIAGGGGSSTGYTLGAVTGTGGGGSGGVVIAGTGGPGGDGGRGGENFGGGSTNGVTGTGGNYGAGGGGGCGFISPSTYSFGGGGGGVGLFNVGTSGGGATNGGGGAGSGATISGGVTNGSGGTGGSGGGNGNNTAGGGLYGGGAGGFNPNVSGGGGGAKAWATNPVFSGQTLTVIVGAGGTGAGGGAVRIIWGTGRSFPNNAT